MKITDGYLPCLLLVLFSFQSSLFGQLKTPSVIVHNFNDTKHQGYLNSLEDSTIILQHKNKPFESVLIEDIDRIDIIVKKDMRGSGLMLGAATGAIPGFLVLVINDRNAKGLAALADGISRLIFGPILMVAGGIIGGAIGYSWGKGVVLEIPIHGNQKIYTKQKDKLIKYSYTP